MKNHFLDTIVSAFYRHIDTRVDDNYDERRFSIDSVDRSQEFDGMKHAGYLMGFITHLDAFYTTYLLLKDDASRELFMRLILYRLLGHLHFRIREEWTWSWYLEQHKLAEELATRDSTLHTHGPFGKLQHFSAVPFYGKEIKADCWSGNILGSYILNQYFLERGDIIIRPEPGDVAIDAGACFGDTAIGFAATTDSEVYAFDLLPDHIRISEHNIRQNKMQDQIRIFPYGVSDRTRNINRGPISLDGSSPGFSIVGQEDKVPTISIDDFVKREKLTKVDFIKMDIEGSELAALHGAQKTIAHYRPKLAISLYHRPEDFVLIPDFLATRFPFYDFYLDHYTIHTEETVLYARARE